MSHDLPTCLHHLDPDVEVALDDGSTAALGAWGEAVAARHLVADDGYSIVARNWRPAGGHLRGELDLIGLDHLHRCVTVVEVKTRRGADRFGGAVATIPPRKQARIRALSGAYLATVRHPYGQVRLDLIAIDVGAGCVLRHLRGVL